MNSAITERRWFSPNGIIRQPSAERGRVERVAVEDDEPPVVQKAINGVREVPRNLFHP